MFIFCSDHRLDNANHRPQCNSSNWLLTSQWIDVRNRSLVTGLSAAEMTVARQLSIVYITSLFDEHCKQAHAAVVNSLMR
jgi:hypothetical protein